jgi:hypothetical protein
LSLLSIHTRVSPVARAVWLPLIGAGISIDWR